jgi:hypothetical protein
LGDLEDWDLRRREGAKPARRSPRRGAKDGIGAAETCVLLLD